MNDILDLVIICKRKETKDTINLDVILFKCSKSIRVVRNPF